MSVSTSAEASPPVFQPTSAVGRDGGRPKVVHITTTDMSLDLLLRPQLEAFAAAGYEVVAASAPGRYVESIEAAGIRHIALDNATRSMDPRSDLAGVWDLVRMMRRERPDVVHTHNPKPGWFGRIAARIAHVPVVINTVHGLYATPRDPWPRRAVVYSLERLASSFSDAELVQNPEDVTALRRLRIPADKLHVLGNGIDLTRFGPSDPATRARVRAELGLADDDVAIGAVGRLVWEKGLRELFSAALELRRTAPNAKVLVVGPLDEAKTDGLGPAHVERIEAETGVRFIGERRDIESIYAALDIYVLASHREGFPRSAMEAAATGLPVVATNIRGCRQVVDHDVTGLLVPLGDGMALASALAKLAADAPLREKFSNAAIDKARREFDQRSVIRITLDTYERLLTP